MIPAPATADSAVAVVPCEGSDKHAAAGLQKAAGSSWPRACTHHRPGAENLWLNSSDDALLRLQAPPAMPVKRRTIMSRAWRILEAIGDA